VRVNPYVAAALVALGTGLSVLAPAAEQGLTVAEMLSAASAAILALLGALHLPAAGQQPASPAKADVEPVVVPVDAEPTE